MVGCSSLCRSRQKVSSIGEFDYQRDGIRGEKPFYG